MKKILSLLSIALFLFACSDPTSNTQPAPTSARQSFAAIPTTASAEPRYLQPGDSAGTYDTVTIKTAKVIRYTSKTVIVDAPYSADSFYTEISKYKAPVSTPPVTTPPPVVTPPASTTELVNEKFESGWGVMRPTQITHGTVAISSNGTKSFRAEVLANDPPKSSGYRDELRLPEKVSDQGHMLYEYDFYIESAPGTYGSFVQWHPNNDFGSGTLLLYNYSGSFQVIRNLKCGSGPRDYCNYYQDPTKLMKWVAKKWYAVKWDIIWSTGSNGKIDLYLDGKLYYSYTGRTMVDEGVYFKLGMNRWAGDGVSSPGSTWTLWYDNIKISRL